MSEKEKQLDRIRATTHSLVVHTYASGLAHLAIATRWADLHQWFGIGSTVLSVFAGSSLLSGSDVGKLVAGILSVIISAIIATTTVLNPGEKSKEHFDSSTSYLVLKNKLQFFYEVESMKTCKDNDELLSELQKLSIERNELVKKCPRISKTKFSKGWKDSQAAIKRTESEPQSNKVSA